MNRVWLRPALLAAAVLLAVRPAGAAVPLKELTQEKLRDWVSAAVKASRDDAGWAAFWKEADPLVVVDADKIVYEHDKGVPVRLSWDARAKRDLTRPERQKAAKDLRKIFDHAIRTHNKGLLSEDDARLLEAVSHFYAASELKARPLKELTEEHVRDWVAEAVRDTRKDPKWADTWKELDRLVVADADEVVYEHDKDKPVKLVWDVAPRKALTAEQRGQAESDLKKLFQYVLFEHDKGLVPADEMEALKAVRQVDVRPNPAPRPKPAKLPPTTAVKDLTADTVHDWMDISYENSRKDPATAALWKELDALVEIDPGAIVYEHDKGAPTKLHWEVTPRRPLTAEERLRVKTDLEKLFHAMLFEHDKGLVPAGEMEVVKDVVAVEIGPAPEPPVAVNPPDNPTDVEKIKKSLDDMKVEFDKLKKEHTDAQLEIEKLKKARDEAQVEIDKTKKERADAVTDLQKLKKEFADALTEVEKLQKERGAAVADLERVKKEQAEAVAELERVKKERAEFQVDLEKLKKEHGDSLIEIEKVKQQPPQGPANPGAPAGPTGAGGAPRGYVMVVQPSSMIYYDCRSHCWLPGPASVMYYPAGPAAPRRELPRPPEYVPPVPPPAEKPLPPVEKPLPPQAIEVSPEEAGRVFWAGCRSYWQGDYDRALAAFDSAVRLDDADARFWYYKALAERALGDVEKAEASARRGRELHAAGKPKADLVGAALERVQGQERRFLNAPEVVISASREDR